MSEPTLDPTAALDTLPERDLAEHVGVFEQVYDALAARLSGAEG
ncbi:hypothetical protein [Georgenia wangjunii]